MARNLANAVAKARPVRASSAVGSAKALNPAPKAGLSAPQPQAPHPSAAAIQTQENVARATTSGGTTMPWDATAEQEAGTAGTDYTNVIAGLGANWVGREAYYGFGENGANNPYSQAAMLATHHEWNERGRSNSSGLQAFAGSNVNAEREEQGRYTTSYNQLLQAYEAERANKVAEEEADRRAYETAVQNAQLGAIQRAAEAAAAPVAPPPSSSPAPAPSGNAEQAGGVVKKNKQGKKIGVGGARKA